MATRDSLWTRIYQDRGTYHVRLATVETPRFRHGFSVGGREFALKAEAAAFADEIDAYMEAVFEAVLRHRGAPPTHDAEELAADAIDQSLDDAAGAAHTMASTNAPPRKLRPSHPRFDPPGSVEEAFFSQCVAGEICLYSFAAFDFSEVKAQAARRGIVIAYCPPGSPEYLEHGDATFRVISVA